MKTNQKKEFLGLQEINESRKSEIIGGSFINPTPPIYCYWNIPPEFIDDEIFLPIDIFRPIGIFW